MSDLLRREAALEKTLAKYRGQPFAWGKIDCVRMLRSHLVAMGHRKVPKVPRYDSALGAKRALEAAGFKTVETLLDSLLPRVPTARALPGDILLLAGDEGLDAVMISVGFKALGWTEQQPEAAICRVLETKGSWLA